MSCLPVFLPRKTTFRVCMPGNDQIFCLPRTTMISNNEYRQRKHLRIYGSVEGDGGNQHPFPLHLSEESQGFLPLVRLTTGVYRRIERITVWLANRIARKGGNISSVSKAVQDTAHSTA